MIDLACRIRGFSDTLSHGSTDFEINKAIPQYRQPQGLDILHDDAGEDDWSMSPLGNRGVRYEPILSGHVLDHSTSPASSLNWLLKSERALGVTPALAIVPGRKEYASDTTDLTFVDRPMLGCNDVTACTGFVPDRSQLSVCNV